jgi:5-methyltetrahydrofolate--homocysteine methyltransferase
LRVYPGRALINSVNGGSASLDAVLPLARRYGAAVVVLALDDAGIPDAAPARMAIVERVRAKARALGLSDASLVVDALVMTAATDAEAPAVALAAGRLARAAGLATVRGGSNVSHGLPDRAVLNAAFVEAAAAAGLDAAIANPGDPVVMQAAAVVSPARVAGDQIDPHGEAWPAWKATYAQALVKASAGVPATVTQASDTAAVNPAAALEAAVLRGDAEAAPALADAVIEGGTAAEDVIGSVLTPAIQRLGDAYGLGEVSLP